MKTYKFVLLGSGGVGKTSLVYQFCHKFFSQAYTPTVEDNYEHLVQLPDGGFQYIEILDTAGYYQFPAQREVNIRIGHAFVIVYSIDNQDTYHHAISQLDIVQEMKGDENLPVILVGNKKDLENRRQVPQEVAEQAATDRGCIFLETSALGCLNVDEAFMKVVQKALEPRAGEDSKLHRRWSSKTLMDILMGKRRRSVDEEPKCGSSAKGKENRRPSKCKNQKQKDSDKENNNIDSRCTIL